MRWPFILRGEAKRDQSFFRCLTKKRRSKTFIAHVARPSPCISLHRDRSGRQAALGPLTTVLPTWRLMLTACYGRGGGVGRGRGEGACLGVGVGLGVGVTVTVAVALAVAVGLGVTVGVAVGVGVGVGVPPLGNG